jgi:CRISPR/Cas system CSM-associated protein Csm2 small subunit
MIKIHKHDSIVDIIIKIKDNKEKDIVLEFPFLHPVLHNYTSLKILKNKA